jgi:HEAT repeat protein
MVRKVAFDVEVCKIKDVKERAIVALYNTGKGAARKTLLEITKDEECKTGWKYDSKNPAVAGGHWMSGVCIAGQIAAEAGWKEFVPALAQALESTYCRDYHRMSILRSISKIAEPGDEVAIKAVRQCLEMTYPYMLAEAAIAASKLKDKESVPRLRELLDHGFLVVRKNAAVALGTMGDTASAPRLRKSLYEIRKPGVLDHRQNGMRICFDENMRAGAAEGLGLMHDKDSLPDLRRALIHEPVPWVRDKITAAIRKIEEVE